MKLNNKGFAMTTLLYGLLILFVILTSSYLVVLNSKKKRLDTITPDIDRHFALMTEKEITDVKFPFVADETGKYIFEKDDIKCSFYAIKGDIITKDKLSFIEKDCQNKQIEDFDNFQVKVYYNGDADAK